MKIYAIFDRIAQESGPLFEAKNDLVAQRMVQDSMQKVNPKDFSLLCLGTYSHDPVKLWAEEQYRVVCGFEEFVEEGREPLPAFMDEVDKGTIHA